jgi:NAD(P)-dependent dehydrogenase (short-subunit alcohol dehydrogenase family)
MTLAGKYALVTGSSRGIGRGIALKLAQYGVKVAVHYYQNEKAAQETLAGVKKAGADGIIVQADVSNAGEVTRMLHSVGKQFGALDIFVSNARTELPTFYQGPMELTLESWHTAVNSQATAFLVGVHEVVALMKPGGRIIAMLPVAVPVAGSPGSQWDRPKPHWNPCAAILPFHLRRGA